MEECYYIPVSQLTDKDTTMSIINVLEALVSELIDD